MTTPNLPYWLAALHLPNIGPRTFIRWLEHFPDIQSLFHASHDEHTSKGFATKHIHAIQNINWKMIEADLQWMQKDDQTILTLEDKDYPPLLKEISDPPLVLYIRGKKSILSSKQIAIVGSRHATPVGLKNAELFASALSEAGFVVTSGLALGIDAAAHRGSLSAKGATLAVCGTGLKTIYPSSHQSLVKNIIKDGAIISEFPLSTGPLAANFPRRNRIISGLSIGTLIVEAALKSGSLITARHALEQGREVFAIPGAIHNPLTRGCHYLIRQGAKLVETVGDILEEFDLSVPPSRREKKIMSVLSVNEQALLEQIEYEITPLDVILLRSRLTAGEVSSILLILELNGYIQSVAGGYVRKILNQ